ncbi:MAG TPA: hypothetical protein VLQ79_10360 [Myxococcaceae bacterium]|nr:hypothetical protein [Myxococcaceae bacterium]
MSYRVRTPEGELEFASLYEISNALRHGLVHAEDELLAPGQTAWARVGDHAALRAEVPATRARRSSTVGRFDLAGTVVFALVGLLGMLLGWSAWVVYGAVGTAVWFSTRLALRATRVRSANRVDSRRR